MAFDLDKLIRENIKRLVPYSSARSEYSGDARIFLDANENAFGSPLGSEFSRYPDPNQSELKSRLAEVTGVRSSQIFVGNGSDEAIDLLIRTFCRPGLDEIMICPPTYGMYEIAAATNDIAVRSVTLAGNLSVDVETVLTATTPETKIIFLCSPNNPTGNCLPSQDILDTISRFDGIVVVDEAYIHYSDEPSMVTRLDECPNLVVLQTFSKAWGLAGLRIGLAFASEAIIATLNKIKPPYNVSQAAQEIALKALDRRDLFDRAIARIKEQRRLLESALVQFRCVEKIYPSDANFILVRVSDAAGLYEHLLKNCIVVRDRSRVRLCEECLRITVGTEAENKELILAIEKYETSTVY
jgi:histidinol-phosphate aminotransferase